MKNFLHDRQVVLDNLSKRLETLGHIEEYLRSATSVHRERIDGFVCRCKLIVAATEELWCYAAVSEIDEDLISKYNRRALLCQTLL